MSQPTDRVALTVGAVLLVLAVSGLLQNSNLARHEWWWPVGVIIIGAAVAVVVRTVRALVGRSESTTNQVPPPL